MELHPTIIAASGEAATQISSSLEEQWGTTLGDGAEVLAFAVPAKCERWAQAIRQIHDAARVARLQRLGYWIDPAINAVWLAELHDPELPRLLSSLEAGVQTGLTQGRELRAHLLLLMPDLFDASPDQQERARENLELLRPTSDALFATRVWPVSARNRADLYLRDPPDDLLPLVQHFVEACLFRSFPFHPNGCRGRDWGGVGCCSFVIGKPSARNLSAYVWTEIKRTIVGPPTSTWQGTVGPALGGELLDLPATFGKDPDRTRFPQQFDNVSGPLLDIPSCPVVQPDDMEFGEAPGTPSRKSCFDPPKWEETVTRSWQAYTTEAHSRCTDKICSKVEGLEQEIAEEGVRAALRIGLPAVEEYRRRLDRALSRANAELAAALEPFDRLMDTGYARRELSREGLGMPAAKRGGSSRDLLDRIEEADAALAVCDLDVFLRYDPEARRIEEELNGVQAHFELNEKQWTERFQHKKTAADGTDSSVSRPRRVLRWIGELLKSFRSLVFRPEKSPSEVAEQTWHKRHCDKAWSLIAQASALQQQRWERARFWLEHWAQFRVRQAYRDAVLAALNRCRQVLSTARSLQIDPVAASQPALLLTLDFPHALVHATVKRVAQELVSERILEELWDGKTDTLVGRILAKAERALSDLPEPRVEELLDDQAWAAAYQIAAPQAMIAHRPKQERYTLVYSPGPLPVLPERLLTDHYWRTGGAVMFRFVVPIDPEDLLEDVMIPRLARESEEEQARPYAHEAGATASGSDGRPNRLLEEVFDADAA